MTHLSASETRQKGLFDDEYVRTSQSRGVPMSHVIAAVSVILNLILLFVLFMRRQWHHYRSVMQDDEPGVTRPKFRRYTIVRDDDVSGVSGTGTVCEVAEFSDGHAALHWLGKWPLTTPHPEGIKQILDIHGHEGKTRLVPVDNV